MVVNLKFQFFILQVLQKLDETFFIHWYVHLFTHVNTVDHNIVYRNTFIVQHNLHTSIFQSECFLEFINHIMYLNQITLCQRTVLEIYNVNQFSRVIKTLSTIKYN